MLFKNIYNIDYTRLVASLFPSFLRKEKSLDWLNSLIEPVNVLHSEFKSYADTIRYKFQHSSQVIYLEKVLNDRFVVSYNAEDHENTKKIYITEGDQILTPYVFLQSENKPVFLNTIFINTSEEIDTSYSDFTINIPTSVYFDQNYLKALVNYYKLAGKSYKINLI